LETDNLETGNSQRIFHLVPVKPGRCISLGHSNLDRNDLKNAAHLTNVIPARFGGQPAGGLAGNPDSALWTPDKDPALGFRS